MTEAGAAPETAEIPAGNLALVFTDIEGSTALWEKLGDRMTPILERHNKIMRHLSEVHRAYEVKTEGDSFFLYFEVVENALAYCLDAQQYLKDEDWPQELLDCPEANATEDKQFRGLRVRMGIHSGKPIIKVDTTTGRMDLHGPVVNAAARISSAAHGGQILMSGRYAELIGKKEYDNESTIDFGEHRLKGMEFSYRLIEVLPISLKGRKFPPVRTLKDITHNLPLKPTSFIGRENEMNRLETLFDDGARFVTVTGAGGSGKSRFTLRYAASHLDRYPGGVWFVPLMDVTTAEDIIGALAESISVPLPSENRLETVGNSLSVRGEALYIFDNFEQITEFAGETLGQWLQSSSEATFLVSSQIPLHVEQEVVFAFEPLAYPDRDNCDVDEYENFPALKLFMERALTAAPAFKITENNIQDAAEICRHLDGIPLAIELAASRCHAMTPKQIMDRLPKRFALLKGATKGLSERKSTLFGAIQWSWELLEPYEQCALVQSVVFNGGFTLEMAEEVLNIDQFQNAPMIMDIIQSLKEKNLLRSWNPVRAPHEIRFDHYESIKRFLEMSEDAEALIAESNDRYADYCLKFTNLMGKEIKDIDSELIRQITANREDFQKHFQTIFDRGNRANIVLYCRSFCEVLNKGGFYLETDTNCEKVLNYLGESATFEEKWDICLTQATTSPFLDKNLIINPRVMDLLTEARAMKDKAKIVRLLSVSAYVGSRVMSQDERFEVWKEAYDLAEEISDADSMALLKLNMSHIENIRFRFEESLQLSRDSISLSRASGGEAHLSLALGNQADALLNMGYFTEAIESYDQSIELMIKIQYTGQIGGILVNNAWANFYAGRLDRTKELLAQYEIETRGVWRETSEDVSAHILQLEFGLLEGLHNSAQRVLDLYKNKEYQTGTINFYFGQYYYEQGHYDDAGREYVDGIKKTDFRFRELGFMYARFRLPVNASLVLPDDIELGMLDKMAMEYDPPVFERLFYALAMGYLAIRRDDPDQAARYADRIVKTAALFSFGEGHPYCDFVPNFQLSYEEFLLAKKENRPAVLFRGYHPATLTAQEKSSLLSFIPRSERESLTADIVAAMMK